MSELYRYNVWGLIYNLFSLVFFEIFFFSVNILSISFLFLEAALVRVIEDRAKDLNREEKYFEGDKVK